MFKPSTSVPKFGEIRLGCTPQDHALLAQVRWHSSLSGRQQ